MTSIGVAGIPSASLVAIAIILAAIGLPAEGIGLILAVLISRILLINPLTEIIGDGGDNTVKLQSLAIFTHN